MRCPKCDQFTSRVVETRQFTNEILRYRACRHCGDRFRTLERVDVPPEIVDLPAPSIRPRPLAAVAPKDVKSPSRRSAARFFPEPDDQHLEDCALEARPLLLQWWCVARWSKHRGNATWTEAAWKASVNRVAELPVDEQLRLANAGVEHGWQALKLEFIGAPPATAKGRLVPKDPAMVAALRAEAESWPA